MIPESVAHHALQAMHNELVVQPYLAKQKPWWQRAWRWLADRYQPSPYGQGYGSNI